MVSNVANDYNWLRKRVGPAHVAPGLKYFSIESGT